MTLVPPDMGSLQQVLRFFDAQKLEHMVVGGVDAPLAALPGGTGTADVLIVMPEEDCNRFAREAGQAGVQVNEAFQRGPVDRLAGLGRLHFRTLQGTRMVRVDVFVLASDYQREAFARRRRVHTRFGEVWMMSREDLVLHRLVADGEGDRAEATRLLRGPDPVDMTHLRKWAAQLGVTDRLVAVLGEAAKP